MCQIKIIFKSKYCFSKPWTKHNRPPPHLIFCPRCQSYHVCASDGRDGLLEYSFLCPNGTIFNQQYFICDWWFNVDCSQVRQILSATFLPSDQGCVVLWLSLFRPRFSGDFSGFPSQRTTVSILIWLTRLSVLWMLWLIRLTRSTISKWFQNDTIWNLLLQASEFYSINFEIDAAMKAEKIDLQGSSSDSLSGGTPTYSSSSGTKFNSETDKFRTGPIDYSL